MQDYWYPSVFDFIPTFSYGFICLCFHALWLHLSMFHVLLLKNNHCSRIRFDQHACQMSLSWLRRGCATEHEWKPARAGPVMMQMNSHQMQREGEKERKKKSNTIRSRSRGWCSRRLNQTQFPVTYYIHPLNWPSTHQPLPFLFWLRIICGKPGRALPH